MWKWHVYANEAVVAFVTPAPLVASLVWHAHTHGRVRMRNKVNRIK